MYLGLNALVSQSLCAAAPLLQLAYDVGQVANCVDSIRQSEQQMAAAYLPDKIKHWAANGISEERLAGLHATMELGDEAQASVQKLEQLLELEGGLWGEIIRRDQVDSQFKSRLNQRLSRNERVTLQTVQQAHRWIRGAWLQSFCEHAHITPQPSSGFVQTTPLVRSLELERELGRPTYLKLEGEQPVGSFKSRGATNLLLHQLMELMLAGIRPEQVTVISASHGNAAQGVVQAAQNLGVANVIVYLPENASPLKVQQLEQQGADVHLYSDTFEDAEALARKRVDEIDNAVLVPAFAHDLIAEGQGTMGLEIAYEMQRTFGHEEFAVVAGAGGLGMLSGLSVALGAEVPLFGAESELLAFGSRSIRSGQVLEPRGIRHIDTIADGSALLRIDARLFEQYVKTGVRDIVAIPEYEIQGAIAALTDANLIAEGSAAATLGAVLFGGLPLERYDGIAVDTPVVLVLSGKNIDAESLAAVQRRYGQDRWRSLNRRARRQALDQVLTAQGFMEQNAVKDLISAERPYHYIRALNFIDTLAVNLPEGWDLIDAFRELDLGSWQHPKAVRATLRSMGEFDTREYPEDPAQQGNRFYALKHPLSNRANRMIQVADILVNRPEVFEALKADLEKTESADKPNEDMRIWIARLAAEIRVIDHYWSHPEWQARLLPEESAETKNYRYRELRKEIRWLKQAIAQVLERFTDNESELVELISGLDQPIPMPLKK